MGNDYELMVVLSPKLADEQLTGAKGRIADEMKDLGAVIEKEDDWGKRDLAFEVKDFLQGYYHLFEFNAPPDMPVKMKPLLRVNETVIRYLITERKPFVLVPDRRSRSEPAPGVKDPTPKARVDKPKEPEAKTVAKTPVEAPEDAPVETPAEAPAEAEAKGLAEAPVEAEAATDTPAETEAKTPVEAPAETAVETPAEVETMTTDETPAEPDTESASEETKE